MRPRATGVAALALLLVALALAGCGSNRRAARTTTTPARTTTAARPAARPAASPTPAPAPAPPTVPASVRRAVRSLSLSRQVAQLFLVGFTGTGLDENPSFFAKLHARDWGGAMLTSDNYVSRSQLRTLAGQLRSAAGKPRPFVAAGQVGGRDNAFAGLPPAGEPQLGATGKPAAARDAAASAGRTLRAAGVSMVFAPDADVGGVGTPVVNRSFSEDPTQVAAFTVAALAGWDSAHVAAAVGNFPGEGGASGDPNEVQATVGGSLAQLRERDLVPFATVAPLAPAIVVSNALYAAWDGVTPAVELKPAIEGVLRGQLGFRGVVVSGDLGATVQAGGGSVGQAAVQALRAGCDLLYLQGSASDQETAYRAVLAAVRSGSVPRARVEEALTRVLELKARYGLLSNP